MTDKINPGRPKGSTKTGEATIQKNVRVRESKLKEITEAGKLHDLTFSQYVNILITNDLQSA